MAPHWRVNTPVPPLLIRAAVLVPAAAPAGWLAAVLIRREAGDGEAPGRRWTARAIIAVIIAFAWTGARGPTAWPLLIASLGLAWALVCLAAIDLASYRLPDVLTLPLLAAGLAAAWLLPGRPLADHVAGAIAGWAVLTALAWAFRRWRGVEGMGQGDAKLFAAGGAWLGWAALPSVMLLACVAAFLMVGVNVLRRGKAAAHAPIAFGAPLCVAILAVWLEGPLTV
jgi:leader peptidase (prepilin peptidase)/N-methyltransferase